MNKAEGTNLDCTTIKVLEEKIRALESENALFKQRNKSLQSELTIARESLKSIDALRERYENGINEMIEHKETYNRLIQEAMLVQKEFEKELAKQIGLINKR